MTGRRQREQLIDVLNRVLRHNLRNDMNVVTGRAEWIASNAEGEVADVAREVVERAWRLIELSEKARSVEATARRQWTAEPRDVVPLVERAAADLRETYPAATVRVSAPDEATMVVNGGLERALYELGENAIEHGDEGPTVSFVVDVTGDRGTVEVRDDGPGLPETEHAVLRGESETPLEHGSGLGLWLVNSLVTGMGGSIGVTVDGGTTIRLSLLVPETGGDPGEGTAAAGPSRDRRRERK
ncbi:MAG: sensor histidine kinase [Haloarculaceae archaeon]